MDYGLIVQNLLSYALVFAFAFGAISTFLMLLDLVTVWRYLADKNNKAELDAAIMRTMQSGHAMTLDRIMFTVHRQALRSALELKPYLFEDAVKYRLTDLKRDGKIEYTKDRYGTWRYSRLENRRELATAPDS